MELDLRLTRHVIAVAEEGGFQKAALRLHMAQPPLSRQIVELEQRLGVARSVAPAHHDLLTTMLAETGQTFSFRQNPVPGLRHLNLDDDASFTLIPESMAASVGPSHAALTLRGTTATLDLELVWRDDRTTPATAAFLSTAQELTRTAAWLPPVHQG